MKKKVLFTASIAKHIIRFHLPYLQWFQEQGYETHVACSGEEEIPYTDVKHTIPFIRSPFRLGHLKTYDKLKEVIEKGDFTIIHCHTPMASVITRLASKKVRLNGAKLVYTAHGFHFFKGSPILNWLTYYPIEMILASKADGIITINEEDYQVIKHKESKQLKVFKIPGVGVNQKRFFPITVEEKIEIRKKNGFKEHDFILVYAAEFIQRKNHNFIIQSTIILKNRIPNLKILFAGRGELLEVCINKANRLGLSKNIQFLGFRNDIDEVFKMSDIGISSSRQEGLGLNLIEEMMCGLPIVATVDRGHKEIVINEENGFLFEQNDSNEFIDAVCKLHIDKNLYKKCSINAIETAKKFELSNALSQMIKIYNCYL